MSTKLEDHLYPRGRSVNEPTLMPNVLDSDGNTITFNSPRRITTEATVVNLGDSPNSNNGDPLRTAFAKINNFIEASYWTNDAINQKFAKYDSELNDGMFIYGDVDSEYLAGSTDYDSDSFNPNYRYGASLTQNSKVHFNGTRNQIQVSINRPVPINEKWTEGHNWDSEIRLKFQLAETLRISKLVVQEGATFDSDVDINGNLVVRKDADLRGDVRIRQNARLDSDLNVAGQMTIGKSVQIDSDLNVTGKVNLASNIDISGSLVIDENFLVKGDFQVNQNATFDSDIIVRNMVYLSSIQHQDVAERSATGSNPGSEIQIYSPVRNTRNVIMDSDLTVTEHLMVDGPITFRDPNETFNVLTKANFDQKTTFGAHARFDSDVTVYGDLNVLGTTTNINTQNLEINDPIVVLAKNNNDELIQNIGHIYQRYDSDSIDLPSGATNRAIYWNEPLKSWIWSSTTASGIDGDVNGKDVNKLFGVGDTRIRFYDSDNHGKMIWFGNQSTFKMFHYDGTVPFVYEIDNKEFRAGNKTGETNPTMRINDERFELMDSDGDVRIAWDRNSFVFYRADGSIGFEFNLNDGIFSAQGDAAIDGGGF